MIWLYRLAQLLGPAGSYGIPDQKADDAAFANFLNGVYFIVGFVSVVVLIIAGITYVTSSGDSGKMTKAKNSIVYAVVGLIITISASVITKFVIERAAG